MIFRILTAPAKVPLWFAGMILNQWRNVATAFVQIWANKARSVLTTLGIIIAVMSTITVVSFVQGFGNHVTDMLRGLGTNMMFIIPWTPGGMHGRMMGRIEMDIDDIRAVISRCDKVRRISPMVFSSVTLEYGREKVEGVELQHTIPSGQGFSSWLKRLPIVSGGQAGPACPDSGRILSAFGRSFKARRRSCSCLFTSALTGAKR